MTEETFTRELERRADDVQGAPLTLADVRGKARSIQRRRRAAAAAVAAVVTAGILVPVALTRGGDGEGPDPAPSPTPSPSVVEPSRSDTSVLRDGVLTGPDGSTTQLDLETADVQQYGVLTDGRVVVAMSSIDDGPRIIRVYGADGELDAEHEVALNEITMSADDSLVGWVGLDSELNGQFVVLETGVTEPTVFEWGVPMPGESFGHIDALYGSDCANNGCTLLAGDFATTTSVITNTSEPAADLGASEPLTVRAVSPGGERWAVTFPAGESEQFGCSGLYDPVAKVVVARSCDAFVWTFSPEGTLLTSATGDNRMWGTLDIVGQELEVVASYEPPADHAIIHWGWEDTRNLLIVISSLTGPQPEWSVVRFDTDTGTAEVLEGPEPGPNPEMESLILLSS